MRPKKDDMMFQVADQLLENVPQDLHVDEPRGRPRRYFIVQRGQPVFVGRQPVQTLAGCMVCELMPLQAKIADKLAIIPPRAPLLEEAACSAHFLLSQARPCAKNTPQEGTEGAKTGLCGTRFGLGRDTFAAPAPKN
jgi:hypothetical protein